jgi:hypothetical protein
MMISSNYNEKKKTPNHRKKNSEKKAPYPSPKKKEENSPANTKNLEDCIPKRV